MNNLRSARGRTDDHSFQEPSAEPVSTPARVDRQGQELRFARRGPPKAEPGAVDRSEAENIR